MSRLIDENTIIKMLNTMDRYTSEELTLCDTDETFPKNEVFIVDDVFEGLDELPSAQPEIIRCAECKWFQCNMRQDGYLPKGVDEFECRHWCGYCDPTDFCSYADRRTNG